MGTTVQISPSLGTRSGFQGPQILRLSTMQVVLQTFLPRIIVALHPLRQCTLNHNLSLLLDQLSPQKHAFLHRSVTTIASGNAPNPEDVEQLLERRNGFSCAFVNCQDHGSGKLGKRLDKAREHILIKHLTSHYVCPYCPTSTARWNDFKKHLVRKHPQFAQTSSETFTCNYCDSPKVLTTKHNLNRHLENVHSVLPQRRIRQD
ncbi:hypothetical protein FRC19_011496 [Serendipita sp. 401]|nr:hypothetical protein FRC19_011496 [Serendipita sp. 401]